MKSPVVVLAVTNLLSPFKLLADETTEPVIVTATRTAQTADESLAAVSVITRADIERSPGADIAGLLQMQAGVDVSRAGGPGQQTNIFMRGTNSDHVLVLIDGVRAGSATTGAFAWQSLDPSQIDHIEVVRGPRATLYGSDAVGGVIQIFTRRPRGVEAGAETGSFRSRLVEAGASAGDTLRVYANVSTRRTDGFSATNPSAGPGLFDPDNDGALQNGANAGLQARLGERTTIDIQTWYSNANVDYDPAASHSESENQVASARWRQIMTPAWTQMLAVGNAQDRIDSLDGTGLPSTRISTERVTGDWQNDVALGTNSLLTFGVNYVNDTGKNLDTAGGNLVYDHNTHDTGEFLNLQYRFANQSIQVGARHDEHSSFGGHNSGQIAWGWDMTGSWRWLASYGTAFKAPDLNQLYHPGYGGLFAGNPDLQPETSRTAELGALYRIASAHQLRISLYTTEVNDLIAFEGVNSQAINIGRANLRGGELEYRLNRGAWRFTANATLQRAMNEITDTELLRRPREKLALRLDRTFLRRGNAGIEALSVSSHADIDNITFNTIDVPGYTVVNLMANYPIGNQWTVTGRVDNLTDKIYENVSGYATSARALYIGVHYASQ